METILKIATPVAMLSGIMLVGYVSMKAVTPTPSDIARIRGPISVEEKEARGKHNAQMMRFLKANAMSDNPIWKFDPPPIMPSFAAKNLTPSKVQLELTDRNMELKKRSELRKERRIKQGSNSHKMLQEIESTNFEK